MRTTRYLNVLLIDCNHEGIWYCTEIDKYLSGIEKESFMSRQVICKVTMFQFSEKRMAQLAACLEENKVRALLPPTITISVEVSNIKIKSLYNIKRKFWWKFWYIFLISQDEETLKRVNPETIKKKNYLFP